VEAVKQAQRDSSQWYPVTAQEAEAAIQEISSKCRKKIFSFKDD